MKTYKQLSPSQQKTIDYLKEDEDSFIVYSPCFFKYQTIVRPNIDVENRLRYCRRTTLMSLVNNKVLLKKEYSDKAQDRYVLNPDFSNS